MSNNKIKLYIYYKTTDQPWGGINSFIRSLKSYIEKNALDEFEIVKSMRKADIIFISAASAGVKKKVKINKLKRLKKKYGDKVKIIHRLDGLRACYNNKKVRSDEDQLLLADLADYIIFQSQASLKCFQKFGFNKNTYTIIHNGVDQTVFNTENKEFYQEGKLKLLAVSWSPAVNKGFKEIAAFSEHDNIEVTFVGNWNSEFDQKKVKVLPPVQRDELVKIYKNNDVFLHPARFDSCPNVVLEAMSCGLPVLYNTTGGTPELAQGYGIALPEKLSFDEINNIIKEIKNNYSYWQQKLQKDKENFFINQAANKYLKKFKQIHEL